MAETTGIQSSEPRSGGGSQTPLKGKNKKWIYLGGGAIALLLLGHKGANSTGGSTSGQQAGTGVTGDSATYALSPGGDAPTTVDTGGGTYNAPGSSISVTTPGATPGATGTTEATDTVSDSTAVPADSEDSGDLTQSDVQGHFAELFPATNAKINSINKAVHPQAPKHKRGSTSKRGASKSGKVHHPSSGAKVQAHSGATAHGRTFPGAKGVTIGAPRTQHGNIVQDVTVNYGGHSATHTSVNQGKQWIDHTKGKNPPSRGPAHTVVANTPARRPAPPPPPPRRSPPPPPPRPAPRPAPRRRGR